MAADWGERALLRAAPTVPCWAVTEEQTAEVQMAPLEPAVMASPEGQGRALGQLREERVLEWFAVAERQELSWASRQAGLA